LKNLAIILILAMLPTAAFAESTTETSHWSLEVKGGSFIPDIDNWTTYYDKRSASEYGGSLAYKLFRQLEVGIEGNVVTARGQGFAPDHGSVAGHVTYKVYPLNVFVLARGVFSDNQFLIPYVGGGWTRMFYRAEVEDQSVARGSVNGSHARAGLQLLLDTLDPSAANNLYLDYGINHTYFFIEAEYTRAMADTVSGGTVKLGGTSWLGGLRFEF